MAFKHKSVVEQVVEELEHKIISRDLEPGQKITEESLSNDWGVSRSSLREAFRILESQGFVVREPRKGVRVTTLTAERVREVYQVMASLEGLAFGLVVRQNNKRVIERLQDMDQAMKIAAKEGQKDLYRDIDQVFHESIIEASGNEFLANTLKPINKLVKRFRAEMLNAPDSIKLSLESHRIIMDALLSGDPDKAENLRRARILANGERIIQKIEADQIDPKVH